MSIYITSKCGHCNVKWEFLNNTRLDIKLGPPVIKCFHCNGLNKTKYKLYRDMNSFEKLWLYFQQTFLRFIFNLFVIGMGLGCIYGFLLMEGENGKNGLTEMLEIKNYLGIVIFSCMGMGPIWLGWSNLKSCFILDERIKNVEDVFDSNGGFVWSHEFYR